MQQEIANGTLCIIDDCERSYIDGDWIKDYRVPEGTLQAKHRVIEALTCCWPASSRWCATCQ